MIDYVYEIAMKDCRLTFCSYYTESLFSIISEVFGEDCPSVRTVERWYLQFRRGGFVLEDQPHAGRLSNVATPESVNAIQSSYL